MGEQIRLYGVRRMDLHFHGDLCTDSKCEKVVLASDHDAEIAQRDARIGELEVELRREQQERRKAEAERDTAREMLRDVQELLDRALQLVAEQAEDEALWSQALPLPNIGEAYIQQELRKLHAVIEGYAFLNVPKE
jgi:hypothetical protein